MTQGTGVSADATDLDLALALADRADALTMARFLAQDLVVETKPDLTPVSDADREAERVLRAALATARPDDAVLGEEFGADAEASNGRRWILDPIDGTKNYVRGVPVWATLIALTVDGVPELGVVSAPALGRRWWALRGEGAWTAFAGSTDARRLSVSGVSALADASLTYSDEVGWGERSAAFAALRSGVWRTRAYGDFWSHLLVAEGAADIAIEPELSPWDVAALVPIVQEAGGRITGFADEPAMDGGCAVTTNGALHTDVLSALRVAG
jgi:histidinol-phosphatase